MERGDELTELVHGSDWLMNLLGIVAALELPDCWIGAGSVRDLVWDIRFGGGFDPADLSAEHEHEIERRLHEREPSVDWDAKNQARVHLWYEAKFGGVANPLTSTIDGISTWPEVATAIAVRLLPNGAIEIAAPYGLDDLLDGVWRRNLHRDSNLVTDADYQARIDRKQPRERWPGLVVQEA